MTCQIKLDLIRACPSQGANESLSLGPIGLLPPDGGPPSSTFKTTSSVTPFDRSRKGRAAAPRSIGRLAFEDETAPLSYLESNSYVFY